MTQHRYGRRLLVGAAGLMGTLGYAGSTIKGTVTSVGSVVKKTKGPTGDPQDTLDVVVAINDSAAVRRFVRAPVDVSLDGMRRPDVLTVPSPYWTPADRGAMSR